MALQIRRGTAAQRLAATTAPLAGEPWFTYDDGQLYVGDGVTPGGVNVGANVPVEALTNVTTIKESIRTIQSFSITSNVAIINLTVNHDYYTGLEIVISGSSTALLNGTYVITSITGANGFAINKTNADVVSTVTNGTVTPAVGDAEALVWNKAGGYWENGLPLMGLNDLSNVNLSTVAPINSDILRYNSTTGKFVPAALTLDALNDVNTTTTAPANNNFLKYSSSTSDFRPAALTLDALDDVNTSTVAPTNGQALVYNTATSLWAPGSTAAATSYTQFDFSYGATPPATATTTTNWGEIGTFTEVTFANLATNFYGPTSATHNPTLSGITFNSANRRFTGFPVGVYWIKATINLQLNKSAITAATNQSVLFEAFNPVTTDSYGLDFFTFSILPYTSYGSVSSRISAYGSVIAKMENTTTANNCFQVLFQTVQDATFFATFGGIQFVKIA